MPEHFFWPDHANNSTQHSEAAFAELIAEEQCSLTYKKKLEEKKKKSTNSTVLNQLLNGLFQEF